jgi:hypothetical protein
MSEEHNLDSQPPKNQSLLDQVLNVNEDELHPWHEIVLPSQGLYYRGQIPGGIVKIKPMGLYADKVLATQRLVRSGEALEYIFRRYVQLPNNFKHVDLLDDDRSFLLYYLRGITHGNHYEFILSCPHCSGVSDHEYDLNELYGTCTPPNPELGEEPFEVRLPDFSDLVGQDFTVKVRFLRGYDTMEMLGAQKPSDNLPGRARSRKKKDWRSSGQDEAADQITERGDSLDDTLEKNINRIIVEAGGDKNRTKIKQAVSKMSSTDIGTIIDFLRENSPGVDTSIETDCTHCGLTIITPLPITASFFRPTKRPQPRE